MDFFFFSFLLPKHGVELPEGHMDLPLRVESVAAKYGSNSGTPLCWEGTYMHDPLYPLSFGECQDLSSLTGKEGRTHSTRPCVWNNE